MRLIERVVCVPVASIDIGVPVIHEEKLQGTIWSIKKSGWKGRPLVIWPKRKRWGASSEFLHATGTHRILAAEKARLKSVPVIIMTPEEMKAALPFTRQEEFTARLKNAGHVPLAELIEIDFEIYTVSYHEATWTKGIIDYLRKEGLTEEVIEVMKVRDWGC